MRIQNHFLNNIKPILLFFFIFAVCLSSCDVKFKNSGTTEKINNGSADTEFIKETETAKEWDIKMLLSICESYETACPNVVFEADSSVSFPEVFPYFMLKGCNNTYMKTVREELADHIDNESGNFVIPCEIAEEYLTRRFNTTVEREKIKYYNAEKNCYEFAPFLGEFYYTQELIDFSPDFNNSIFVLDVVNRHSLADDKTVSPERKKYTLSIDGNNEYKIIGVESLDAVTIKNKDSEKFFSFNCCELTLDTQSSGKDLYQNWWIAEVPKKTSVYSVRNTYDSSYGLCVNSDGRLCLKKLSNQYDSDESLAFQFEFIKNSDGTFCLRSLSASEEKYLCDNNGTPGLAEGSHINWEINASQNDRDQ